MFNNIKGLLGEDSPPEKIHLDFEAATIRACKETLLMIVIIGCQVHWKRSKLIENTDEEMEGVNDLFFQVDELGLGSVANSNLEVQTYLRYLWDLPWYQQTKW